MSARAGDGSVHNEITEKRRKMEGKECKKMKGMW